MKKTMQLRIITAAGVIGLAACDAPPPEGILPEPAEPAKVSSAQPGAAAALAPGETVAAVIREADPYARARRLATLLPKLGPEAVPEVRETLLDNSLDFGSTEIELLTRFWASHEPEAASRWAVEECPPAFRSPAVLTAVAIWARADPYAALDAITVWEKSRADVRDLFPIALVRGWFARDPRAVAQQMQQLEMGFARQRMLSTFVRSMMQQEGPAATMRWAESVSEADPSYKLAVYRQVGAALPLFDHDAALAWCEAQCDGPHGKNLRGIIARRWVLTDGEAAMDWLSSAPESHERESSLWMSYRIWSEREPEAAMAWVASRPRGENGEPAAWLEPVLPSYARLLARESPSEAIEWAEAIEEDVARELTLVDIARRWRAQDEAAAEAWLAESSLSEENREKARNPAQGPGVPVR